MYGDQMNVMAGPEERKKLRGILENHCATICLDPALTLLPYRTAMRDPRALV